MHQDMTDLFGGAPTIKALSVWEPWASLIAAGVKRHETRHWETTYRGPIAIQAARTLDLAGAPDQLCQDVLGPLWPKERPRGRVVAVAYLSDCIPTDRVLQELTAADREAGNYAAGRFAWRLDDIRPLTEPIPLTGRQGLFNWEQPQDLRERLEAPRDHHRACTKVGWA
ncbi:MAG TPA: hypothetical protein DCP26_08540 [Brevundimonas sp.]|nr:hypothetical protein [Brevundimonas sp.]